MWRNRGAPAASAALARRHAASGHGKLAGQSPRSSVLVRLVDKQWEQELRDGLAVCEGSWSLACPFIKQQVIERLLAVMALDKIELVTRFNLADFAAGVSDVGALRAIVNAGGQVRGLRGLHSKVFIFGDQRAAVTSANLTTAALSRNAEFGCISQDPDFVGACREYLDELWQRASAPVTIGQLDEWDAIVTARLAQGGRPSWLDALPDFGASSPLPSASPFAGQAAAAAATSAVGWPAESGQAWVKFFGQGHDRASPDAAILDQIDGAGCHWACTYPKGRRPRSVSNGDTMFMGRLTHSPNDTLIFGRAIALAHVDDRDTASADEIERRSWKVDWPNYIRVHHAEFIAGKLSDGISLGTLMDELGPNAFGSTQENLLAGQGRNTNPRKALRQQPAVRLTAEAMAWLTERFEHASSVNGRVPTSELDQLDWPS